jgi:hypothetical protein
MQWPPFREQGQFILSASQQPKACDMQCKLAEEKQQVWPGRTFTTTSVSGGMLPAAVYMPPIHNGSATMLNVLLFLHGWYVPSKVAIINSDNCRPCEQIINSGKDVILVAPWLGYKSGPGKDNGVLQTDNFANTMYGQLFLKAILDALPAAAGGPASLDIKNLILACHSGGGVAMRNVVATLGGFKAKLRECVGLDCLYTRGKDGDANFWFDRAKESGASPAFFFFGPSTIPESIKLYLMAKGRADALGNERNPAGPAQDNLLVRPGHISSFMYGGAATNVSNYIDNVVDDLIAQTSTAPGTTTTAKDGEFVEHAVENFKARYIFPVDEKDARGRILSGGIHYFIARAFLLERLRNVSLV